MIISSDLTAFLGRDYKHSIEMQKIIKNELKSFDVILLLFNGKATRYNDIIFSSKSGPADNCDFKSLKLVTIFFKYIYYNK